ncbi:hypothetical protein AXF42_Ash013183 [Apostasia shenzhenica]|uniref:DUF7148 domain-containing protein n=1 Tax=Apostasia shenzhenica TaxID=1088818 RepID=A0A2I0BDA0_9ASPA|nr:hypothetical protein AXF42_Ash013183 [Apostasia shenzhenica]
MMAAAARQLLHLPSNYKQTLLPRSPSPRSGSVAVAIPGGVGRAKLRRGLGVEATVPRSKPPARGDILPSDADDGVSLGTMKLPPDTDIPRFETLLFQLRDPDAIYSWQVDKVKGGARLGFVKLEDGKTEVCVYIDCLVFPATGGSGPVFRAVRNGPLKNMTPPGEPRIIRSLLQALQKSVQIAKF